MGWAASGGAWLRRWAVRWGRAGVNLVFPPGCARCEAELDQSEDDVMLCGDCREALGPADWTFCRRCGAQVAAERGVVDSCEVCRGVPLRFDGVVALGSYQREALRESVLRMKHPAGDVLSAALGRLFCRLRGEHVSAFGADLVVPVPMYWTRRLAHGTNSPDLLAECLGRYLGAAVVERMVSRCRNTLPQKHLSPRRRFQNVRGAFRLRAGYDLSGARLVVVDDILTTGATASEVAGVLKKAGAANVVVAVIARAVGGGPS